MHRNQNVPDNFIRGQAWVHVEVLEFFVDSLLFYATQLEMQSATPKRKARLTQVREYAALLREKIAATEGGMCYSFTPNQWTVRLIKTVNDLYLEHLSQIKQTAMLKRLSEFNQASVLTTAEPIDLLLGGTSRL